MARRPDTDSATRGRLLAVALLWAVACGKATPASTGLQGQGGSVQASGGTLSEGGLPGIAGEGAGEGGGIPLADATNEEQAILKPLFLDSAEIDQADVQRLIEMGASIGVARGYAMCRCAQPRLVPGDLMPCAVAETGRLAFTRLPPEAREPRLNQELARCLREESAARPWLVNLLRCDLQWHQEDGRAWLKLCGVPDSPRDGSDFPMTPFNCPGVDEAMLETYQQLVFLECQYATYCADGARFALGRCSAKPECADWSDERSCFEVQGRDMLRCGDELRHPQDFCASPICVDESAAPRCNDARPELLHCPDGTELSHASVCDRKNDCADGADERYCLR